MLWASKKSPDSLLLITSIFSHNKEKVRFFSANCSRRRLPLLPPPWVTACSAPAARLPALATDDWHLCNIADIDNKERSELDRDLDDVEEVEEEETGEETKIKACQLSVEMMQNPRILAALQERLIRWSGRNSSRMHWKLT